MIRLVIPGIPIAQPRVKATRRGKHVRVYNPTKSSSGKSNGIAEFKLAIRLAASQIVAGDPYSGALRVDAEFVFPRPTNMVWKTKPMPRVRKTTKPDVDNLKKAVLDALNGVVWCDDSQVCEEFNQKWIAAGDEEPHTVITISAVREGG